MAIAIAVDISKSLGEEGKKIAEELTKWVEEHSTRKPTEEELEKLQSLKTSAAISMSLVNTLNTLGTAMDAAEWNPDIVRAIMVTYLDLAVADLKAQTLKGEELEMVSMGIDVSEFREEKAKVEDTIRKLMNEMSEKIRIASAVEGLEIPEGATIAPGTNTVN